MASGYQVLRVEDGPSGADALAGASTVRRSPPPSSDDLTQLRRDVDYYKSEMKRAIKEREEIKASLEHADGPAAFWRAQAKESSRKLVDAIRRVERAREAEEAQRAIAIKFSEEVDALTKRIAALKLGLWELWGSLSDTPLKQQLWAVWRDL